MKSKVKVQKEIFKTILNYPDYEISNFGRVKSLKFGKEKYLKLCINSNGYFIVGLSRFGIVKTKKVHKLVAIAFLNHKPNGYELVVDHKDNNPLNNSANNLRLITQRENCHTHYRGSSKYKGVHFHKISKKWNARILINKKRKELGSFKTEYDAHNAYQLALSKL